MAEKGTLQAGQKHERGLRIAAAMLVLSCEKVKEQPLAFTSYLARSVLYY